MRATIARDSHLSVHAHRSGSADMTNKGFM
jgi:hypothetical protein